MASIRKLPSGNWQARVRLPDGSTTSRTWQRKAHAHEWAARSEQAIREGRRQNPRELSITHTSDGLDIHVPDTILTMDMAQELEMSILAIVARHGG